MIKPNPNQCATRPVHFLRRGVTVWVATCRVVLFLVVGLTAQAQIAPSITSQPSSQSVVQGQPVNLLVGVAGDPPLVFQWRRSGSPLLGATNINYTIASVQLSDAGNYDVVIFNNWGAITSQVATLTVGELPAISSPPEAQTVPRGGGFSLTVAATGPGPLSYQWLHNGAELAGATNGSLTISNAQLSHGGSYRVRVGNDAGSVLSQSALVTVLRLDFGDAPDLPFPTSLARDGARHQIGAGLFLGAGVDDEPDGQGNASATGDDGAGVDDEDGVIVLTPLSNGATARLAVVASATGILNAWIDYNGNGSWAEVGEQVVTNRTLLTGTNVVSFGVPANAVLGQVMSRFRFSSAPGLGVTGLAADGEVEDYALTIQPSVDLNVVQDDDVSVVGLNSNVTFLVEVTNQGIRAAQDVVLMDIMPAGMTLVLATLSQGSCTVQGGVVRCALGTIPVAGRVDVSLRMHAGSIGTKLNRVTVTSSGLEATPGDNTADEETLVVYASPLRLNPQVMTLPVLAAGPADLYPSTIFISGLTATVYQVIVSLQNINHGYPEDLDVLLAEPGGAGMVLVSDCCGDGALVNTTFTFNDDAAESLPDSVLDTPVPSGVYRPSNYGSGDQFPAPALFGPYGTALSFFEGINPNGTWSLYAVDDLPEDGGSIGGWSLRLVLLDPMSDLGVTVAPPAPVGVGSNLTYQITVTNHGPAVATGVIVEDLLPLGTTFVSASSSQGSCEALEGLVRCELGVLPIGTPATVTVVARTSAAGQVVNQVEVTSLGADFNETNDRALTPANVLVSADLKVTMAASPDPVLLGQPLTYSIVVTNRGPSQAQSVNLVEVLPAGVELISSMTSQGTCSNSAGMLQCALGSIAFSGKATVTVVVRPTVVGSLTNRAMVSVSSELDPVATNNVAQLSSVVVPSADLSVRSIGSSQSVLLGDVLTYTLAVSNAGPSAATGVVLSNVLAQSVTVLSMGSSSGGCELTNKQVRCEWATLAASEQAVVTIEVRPSVEGSLEALAGLRGGSGDPTTADRQLLLLTQVLPVVDLGVSLIKSIDPVILPQSLSYTIVVSNRGPSLATSVVLTNLLPAGAELLASMTSQGTCSNNAGVVRCTLGELPAGSSATITLQVRPTESGSLTNRAEVAAAEAELNLTDNSGAVTSLALVESGVFMNPEPIVLATTGAAVPYPSSIEVSGLTLRVDSVLVTLHGLSHSFADDLDFLLVGPEGQAVLLMSDAGGAQQLEEITLQFASEIDKDLPDADGIVSGTYRPTNYGVASDEFPDPAPLGPFAGDLAVFRDVDPNGTWVLYAVDDADKDIGLVAGGWSLRFGTTIPVADLTVSGTGPVAAAPMSNLVYTVSVTNQGPSPATGVAISTTLPLGFIIADLSISQGGCNFDDGRVTCQLGRVQAGAGAVFTMSGRIGMLGSFTNVATVTGLEVDPNTTNNTLRLTTSVEAAVMITDQPAAVVVAAEEAAVFMVGASGAEPFFYQWFREGQPLVDQTAATLSLAAVSFQDQGNYTVLVSNRVSSVSSVAAGLTVLSPPIILEPPQNRTLVAGRAGRLEVVAIGTETLRYRWFFMGQPVPDQTNAVLLLPTLTLAQSGNYSVEVRNDYGVVTSPQFDVTVREADFGDAPRPGYPTDFAANGSHHFLFPGMFLGQGVDSEPDGQPTATANGDDIGGTDDEDGVRFLDALLIGTLVRVEVVASISGLVNAWVDFDGNESWTGPGEQIFTNAPVSAGTNLLMFRVVRSAFARNTFARFRYSSSPGLGVDGPATDGEVEDYEVNLVPAIDLAVRQSENRDPSPLGSTMAYTLVVTNSGPSRATVVTVEDRLPSGFNLVSATSSQGSCGSQSGSVICSIGSVSSGGSVTIVVVVMPTVEGSFTNRVTVSAPEQETLVEDNTSLEETRVLRPPLISQAPQAGTVIEGATVELSVTATGSAPLSFQWSRDGEIVPDATNSLLRFVGVTVAQGGLYTVRVFNPVASTNSPGAQLTVFGGALPALEPLPPSSVSSTGAVLRARVDPNRLATGAWFEWGTSTNYGQLTPVAQVGTGDVPVEVMAAVGALQPGTEYHYRVVATNFAGRAMSGDTVFSWKPEPLPEFVEIRRLPNGNMRLFFLGVAGQVYHVEGATNLTAWESIDQPFSSGAGMFQIDVFGGSPYQFFRVFSP